MKQAFVLIMFLAWSMVTMAQEEDAYSIPDQYIVQLNGGIKGDEFFGAWPDLKIIECLSKHMNIWLVRSVNKNNLYILRSSPSVRVVQYNHDHIIRRSIVPNDSLFNLQWNLQNPNFSGDDISAPQAWQLNHSNLTQTGDSIVIAVVDGGQGSGFDIYHPDINFFVNHHEIPNNGIDDDGNGYIDDYHGWNVFTNTDSVYSVSDHHATHVSGIAAAKGNNNIGIAGVCWGAKVLAINAASNTESDVVKAYDYVIEMRKLYDLTSGAKGAFIVATNSSFGVGNYGANPVNYPIWCAMYDSMGTHGILSSIATPDFGVNVDAVNDVPTGCPSKWMIAVTNTTRSDGLNSQAGYGPTTVDIGAPGTSIVSCFPGGTYGYDGGTSMSCPHVTGAVASIFANACPKLMQDYFNYPDSISLMMRDYILHSVDPLSALENITTTGGRLNLYHAFVAEDSYNCNNCNYAASLTQQNLICFGDSTASISVSAGTNNSKYHYLWSNGDTVNNPAGLKAGLYQVTITDTSGCQRQLNTLITHPQAIVVSSITVIPISTSSAGNIIVSAQSGNDSLTYAIDSGSYQTGAIFVTSAAGVHIIHIRNHTGCVYDTAIGIYYTGIGDLNNNSSIIVYPNPSNGSFYFSGVTSGSTIQIYDMLGREVNITSSPSYIPPLTPPNMGGGQSYSVNLTGKPIGVYFYRVTDRNNNMQQGKIVLE